MKTDTRTHAGMAQWYSSAFVPHDLGVQVLLPAPETLRPFLKFMG